MDLKIKMNQNEYALWDKIVHELLGSCDSLDSAIERNNAPNIWLNSEFCEFLDSRIFLCDNCGWWHNQSEMSEQEDWVCINCAPVD